MPTIRVLIVAVIIIILVVCIYYYYRTESCTRRTSIHNITGNIEENLSLKNKLEKNKLEKKPPLREEFYHSYLAPIKEGFYAETPSEFQEETPSELEETPREFQEETPREFQEETPREFQEEITGEFQEEITGEFQEEITGEFQEEITGEFQEERRSSQEGIVKYLHVDSTYRDRINYPYTSDFIIPYSYISSEGNNFSSNRDVLLQSAFFTRLVGGAFTPNVISLADLNFIGFDLPSRIDNYYVGNVAFILDDVGNVFINKTKITKYLYADPSNFNRPTIYCDPVLNITGQFIVYITKDDVLFLTTLRDTDGTTRLPDILSPTTIQLVNPPVLTPIPLPLPSTVNDSYKGSYLQFFVDLPQLVKPYYKITSYDATNKIITIDPPLDIANIRTRIDDIIASAGSSFDITTIAISQLKRDNQVSLLQSSLGEIKSKCRVKILSLSIPYQPLVSGEGGYIDRYPYVYLKLYNNNSPQSQILFSNNPHSSACLFKIMIEQYNGVSNFLHLKIDDMEQTVNLSLKEDLRFSLTLPNGELVLFQKNNTFVPLTTLLYQPFDIHYVSDIDIYKKSDSSPPTDPYHYMQISACFKIEVL